MNEVEALHQCRYGHQWVVMCPDFGSTYPHPTHRFCAACLEADRIEVAYIQLTMSPLSTARMTYQCPFCPQVVHFPLVPSLSFLGVTTNGDTEDMFAPRPGWYHFPTRWPFLCEHTLSYQYAKDRPLHQRTRQSSPR